MTTTQAIAAIAGVYFLAAGLGLLLSTDFYAKLMANTRKYDPLPLVLSAAVALIAGMTILVLHWRWTSALEVVVSLIGLIAAIKGAALLALPDAMRKWPALSRTWLRVSGAVFAAIGVSLVYAGLVA
jgi:multisubunit Na+/H+ antiporter MnhG subunit